jgi:oxygen-independent coproporphyrinogen-3 oxidase
VLTSEDQILRQHILNLMTRFETNWERPESYVPHLGTLHDRLLELENDGLVNLGDTCCAITETGKPFLRNICMAFDARLAADGGEKQLFSRTI